jgi:hypothetical protein
MPALHSEHPAHGLLVGVIHPGIAQANASNAAMASRGHGAHSVFIARALIDVQTRSTIVCEEQSPGRMWSKADDTLHEGTRILDPPVKGYHYHTEKLSRVPTCT